MHTHHPEWVFGGKKQVYARRASKKVRLAKIRYAHMMYLIGQPLRRTQAVPYQLTQVPMPEGVLEVDAFQSEDEAVNEVLRMLDNTCKLGGTMRSQYF
jgi:hypothetical protein